QAERVGERLAGERLDAIYETPRGPSSRARAVPAPLSSTRSSRACGGRLPQCGLVPRGSRADAP
ncbi:hypothetical protein AB0C69_29055, partial [Actinomadura sp. NPDC048032]|uniref:hypothetical protein n=1 Tax=Actinomadura sp. NPDC048032 TaxID=3155747 RepID=UPI0033DB45C6